MPPVVVSFPLIFDSCPAFVLVTRNARSHLRCMSARAVNVRAQRPFVCLGLVAVIRDRDQQNGAVHWATR